MSLQASIMSEFKMSGNNLVELAIRHNGSQNLMTSPMGSVSAKLKAPAEETTLKYIHEETGKESNNLNNVNTSGYIGIENNPFGSASDRESERQKWMPYKIRDKTDHEQKDTHQKNGFENHLNDSMNHYQIQGNHHDLESEGYDMLKIPAEWSKAELHAKSRETKPELDGDADGEMQAVCECCGYELERKKVSLNVDIMDLGFLGSGYPLFYNYIKYCCLMLASLFVIEGIPNLITNLQGNFCHNTDLEVYEAYEANKKDPVSEFIIPCPESLLNKMSMANVIDSMQHQTNYSFHYSIAAIIVQIALSMIFRRSQRAIEFKVDEENSTPSDFTIMVQNISTQIADIQGTLIQIFSRFGVITKVNLVYDIGELEVVEKQIHKTIKFKQKALMENKYDLNAEAVKQMDIKLHNLEKEEHDTKLRIKQTKFVGTAFVSFEEEQQKQDAIDQNPQNDYKRFLSYFQQGRSKQYNESLYLQDRHLYVSEAPEPNDVDWEFAHVATDHKISSRFQSFLKWGFLSILCFVVIFAISYYQSHETESVLEKQFHLDSHASADKNASISVDPSNNTSTETTTESGSTSNSTETANQSELDSINQEKILITTLSFVISALIVIWNKFALPLIIHKICDNEKWSTKTSMNISFAFKLTLGLFFNTALITFFVEVIFLQNIYGFAGGMIYNEFLVFIFNAVVPSLAWIIDPWKICSDCKRSSERKKPFTTLTQGEANLLMENPSYSMGKRYADIMKTMWFTFFYSPIMPIGTIISLGGLIAYYFTDKYNLLFRRTVKESISSKLSFEMVEFVEFSMLFHTFGHVFFKWFMAYHIDVGNFFLFIAVSVIVLILPMQKINEFMFPIQSINDAQKYSDVVHTFDTDYDRENPITRKQSLLEYQILRKERQNQNQIQILSDFQAGDGRIQ